jgi:hypothetical protein
MFLQNLLPSEPKDVLKVYLNGRKTQFNEGSGAVGFY